MSLYKVMPGNVMQQSGEGNVTLFDDIPISTMELPN